MTSVKTKHRDTKIVMKNFINKILWTFNCELIRHTKKNKNILQVPPNVSYRELIIEEVMLSKGEINLTEALFLGNLVRELPNEGPIVEIGTLFGASTLVMVLQKSVERKLITVDNYSWNPLGLTREMHFAVTKKILSEATDKFNVKQLNLNKTDFYRTYEGDAPALVFLDAIHTYEETKADILWAKDVNASFICGHDYDRGRHPEVVKAVDEFGGCKKLVETLWVL